MENKYDALKLSKQLCFPLYACSREMIKLYKPYLDELCLTYTQYITMMLLWEFGTTTAKELGQRLYLDSGTLTPVLRSLDEKGFVIRRRSSEDERVLIVKLTEKGAALREDALTIPYEVVHCVNFSADEATQLQQLLYKLLSALPE